MPTPFQTSVAESTESTPTYAQTLCFTESYVAGVDLNHSTTTSPAVVNGISTADSEWQLFDGWSTHSTAGHEFEYQISGTSYQVLNTGFRVLEKGIHKVTALMHASSSGTNYHNVALQIAKKASGGSYVRLGAPSLSGYLREVNFTLYGQIYAPPNNYAITLSQIVQCESGEEISVFTTRVGQPGAVLAPRKLSSFSIERL